MSQQSRCQAGCLVNSQPDFVGWSLQGLPFYFPSPLPAVAWNNLSATPFVPLSKHTAPLEVIQNGVFRVQRKYGKVGLKLSPTLPHPITSKVNIFFIPIDSEWGRLEWEKEGNCFFHLLSAPWTLAFYVIKLQ